ncbi:metalloprotease [Cercophora scortea]|uniref:Metalloprotease n=1 Tax=Cercophora scortea TaxID=314031 RepID=A0AAE0I347_9PEZI|nr:metalloprotease [Cercophora scortea]
MARDHICAIVPPHLLDSMSKSSDPEIRESAITTLSLQSATCKHRHEFLASKASGHRHHGSHGHGGSSHPPAAAQGIVPGVLLESIAQSESVDDAAKEEAQKNIAISQQVRDDRAGVAGVAAGLAGAAAGGTESGFWRGVYDMHNRGNAESSVSFNLLPGTAKRLEGQDPATDKAVNEAYDSALKVLEFYKKTFNYNSLDNEGMRVKSSVHFAKGLGNAFWLSTKSQMVYGDGNKFIHNFTSCIDVIGHEMTHAVTQYNSGLEYQDESGALNEHLSDAFGIMVKQSVENETAADADWLIGEGVLLPGVKGVALRNMKEPGTAYNDPRFGADIQPQNVSDIPAVMAKYGSFIRDRDYGGVHIFSGIPNRAFALAAIAFGGYTWEKAGQIWWKVATGGVIASNCTFVQFADATVDAAQELFGDEAATTVRDAWNQVGVVRSV